MGGWVSDDVTCLSATLHKPSGICERPATYYIDRGTEIPIDVATCSSSVNSSEMVKADVEGRYDTG